MPVCHLSSRDLQGRGLSVNTSPARGTTVSPTLDPPHDRGGFAPCTVFSWVIVAACWDKALGQLIMLKSAEEPGRLGSFSCAVWRSGAQPRDGAGTPTGGGPRSLGLGREGGSLFDALSSPQQIRPLGGDRPKWLGSCCRGLISGWHRRWKRCRSANGVLGLRRICCPSSTTRVAPLKKKNPGVSRSARWLQDIFPRIFWPVDFMPDVGNASVWRQYGIPLQEAVLGGPPAAGPGA